MEEPSPFETLRRQFDERYGTDYGVYYLIAYNFFKRAVSLTVFYLVLSGLLKSLFKGLRILRWIFNQLIMLLFWDLTGLSTTTKKDPTDKSSNLATEKEELSSQFLFGDDVSLQDYIDYGTLSFAEGAFNNYPFAILESRGTKGGTKEDLHGLKVRDALERVKRVLRKIPSGTIVSNVVKFITGKGNRSKDGIPVIKRAVEGYLKKNGYKHWWENQGMVAVARR